MRHAKKPKAPKKTKVKGRRTAKQAKPTVPKLGIARGVGKRHTFHGGRGGG